MLDNFGHLRHWRPKLRSYAKSHDLITNNHLHGQCSPDLFYAAIAPLTPQIRSLLLLLMLLMPFVAISTYHAASCIVR